MTDPEKKMIAQYRKLVLTYQNSFPVDFNFFTDMEPPKDYFIEVQVLEDCGELIQSSGIKINLQKNQIFLVRKKDIEHLIK